LKTPQVSSSVRRRVKSAADLAELLLERRHPAVSRPLTPRERTTESVAATLFTAVAVAMALSADAEPTGTAALLIVSYALTRRVRFQLGPGLIRPTEVVFVPMLFLTPAAAVPALVALGSLLGELPELARHRAHPERILVILSDGWYAVGPALVIMAAGDPDRAHEVTAAILLLALAAQFAGDLIASTAREYFGAHISATELFPVLALVYLIDACLAPIGFLAAVATEVVPGAYLLAIAPGALLGIIARERSGRIAHELALERAFRRSTRALDARAEDLHRHAGRLQRGETAPEDRAKLERILLATTVEALQADAGRLSEIDDRGALAVRLAIGGLPDALDAAERDLGATHRQALAIGVGHSHVLSIVRTRRAFDTVERDLLEHLAAQAAVSLENLRLEELAWRGEEEQRARAEAYARIAHTLQQSLLPPELPLVPGFELGALYLPQGEGNEVGGDFYDVFSTGEKQWFAVIGDVCGKGAQAAAVTALVRYTVRAAVVHHRSPAGILRWLNAAMLRQRAGRFVTLACARIDIDDPITVTVACGGHPPPRILRSTGLVEEIGEPGMVLGVLPEVRVSDTTTRLARGDGLVLYTDGLTESSAPAVWTPHQLDAALAGARRQTAQGIVEHLGAQATRPLRDDLALLALRVQPLL
jgi:serine phosphatase RsbU (regulator of sigma subunit)